MSDRIEFFEVRKGTEDDWDHVCLAKSEDTAKEICLLYKTCMLPSDDNYFVEHVEIVASTSIDISEY